MTALIISRSIAQLSSTSAPAFPPSFLSQNSPINYLEFNSMIVWIASLFPVLLNMSIWLSAPTRPITVNRLELWHLYLLTYLPGLSSTDHHHRHHEWRLIVIIATSSYSHPPGSYVSEPDCLSFDIDIGHPRHELRHRLHL